MTENNILTEELIVESLGYLKVPKRFKDKYPDWKDKSPLATMIETPDSIKLTYIFSKEAE